MGTLPDASDAAFRHWDKKRTTDSQGERENAVEQRATDGERIAGEENEKQAFDECERTDASSSAVPEQSSRESRHDPGGSWLTKVLLSREKRLVWEGSRVGLTNATS
ncbi:hypothetical protein NDU88_009277 [Pleurodeles waltl]|uniref:Uncharacterized protein n=1 Tax=Pleurodeles waltl TaxID=8319 RepID=A0AAV7QSI2_PLEWA|nr:hypothetical protein NDU88_009277 [Pleurodeles waltl]